MNIITLEEGWSQIKTGAIDRLFLFLQKDDFSTTGLFSSYKEYMDIYTVCYRMCTQTRSHNYSDKLYEYHKETISNYLLDEVRPSIMKQPQGELFLQEFHKRWVHHQKMTEWMRKFFMYLDRFYIKHNHLPSLQETSITLFRQKIYHPLKMSIAYTILNIIDQERNGTLIDQGFLRSCINIFIDTAKNVENYILDFEAPFLTASRYFYKIQSETWIMNDPTTVYLLRVETALYNEQQRITNYLQPSTKDKLLQVVREELLEKPQKILLEREGSGLMVLFQNDKGEDISRMYQLFLPIGLDLMVGIFKNHLLAQNTVHITEFLELHEKYLSFLCRYLDNHPLFQKALTEAFQTKMNMNSVDHRPHAERLSTFCDPILKKSGNDEEVDEILEKVVQLLTYVTDKDLFLEIYKNQLAKRLLTQKSFSEDWEKLMISKLKLRCGAQYTSRMEGMLHDLRVHNHYEKGMGSVRILTAGYWPPSTHYPHLVMPNEMRKYMEEVTEQYRNKHSGRRLTWCYGLGSAILRYKSFHLHVSTLQAVILLMFSGELTLREIHDRVPIPLDHLQPLMHSLSCTKHKILVKIEGTDRYVVNTAFTSPKKAVTIPIPILENTNTARKVEEDRSHTVDAAIVRIMKTRKVMSHLSLVGEVIGQLTLFRPDLRLVKQRIHSLVDREFLERDIENIHHYKYMA
jgi:cullin 1